MLIIKVNNKKIVIDKKNGKYVFNGWITVKKDHNNEEETGRHLFIREGETPKEAMKRAWGVDLDKRKKDSKAESKEDVRQKRGLELIGQLKKDFKGNSYEDADPATIEEVEKITGKKIDRRFIVYKKDLMKSLYDKFKPNEKTLSGLFDEVIEHARFSKNDLKKSGLKIKEVEEVYAESDDLLEKSRNIYQDKNLSYDEKVEKFRPLLEEAKKIKEKKETYAKEATARKEKKIQKQETAKQNAQGFEISKETKKAYLITKDGKQAWIQKRWIKDDGSLTPSAEEAINKGEKLVDIERENAEREKGLELPKTPDWEGEKSVGYDVNVNVDTSHYSEAKEDYVGSIKRIRDRIFIPKSMIKGGRIPAWLAEKKIEELEQKYFSERAGIVTASATVPNIFGKRTYYDNGRKIAFTKEKADYISSKMSKYLNDEEL